MVRRVWRLITSVATPSMWVIGIFMLLLGAGASRWLSGGGLSLSGLDLFFFVTTVLSLMLNLLQIERDNQTYGPLRASLIALFNDLKARQLRATQRQQLLRQQKPDEAGTLHLQFYDYTMESVSSYEQIKEHVVGAIHTLDPEISSAHIFTAANFGMTPEEIRRRNEDFFKTWERKPDEEKLASPADTYRASEGD